MIAPLISLVLLMVGQPGPLSQGAASTDVSELPPGATFLLFNLFQAQHYRLAAEGQDCGRIQQSRTQDLNSRHDRMSERLRGRYGAVTDRVLSTPPRPVREGDPGCRSGAILDAYGRVLDGLESFADLLIPVGEARQ